MLHTDLQYASMAFMQVPVAGCSRFVTPYHFCSHPESRKHDQLIKMRSKEARRTIEWKPVGCCRKPSQDNWLMATARWHTKRAAVSNSSNIISRREIIRVEEKPVHEYIGKYMRRGIRVLEHDVHHNTNHPSKLKRWKPGLRWSLGWRVWSCHWRRWEIRCRGRWRLTHWTWKSDSRSSKDCGTWMTKWTGFINIIWCWFWPFFPVFPVVCECTYCSCRLLELTSLEVKLTSVRHDE